MYTAAVLRSSEVIALIDVFQRLVDLEPQGYQLKTPEGEPLPHHMTINLGRFDTSLNPAEFLGKPAEIVIDSIHWSHDHNICAANVIEASVSGQQIRTINSHPHITICLRPPAKPFHSNKMLKDDKRQYYVLKFPRVLYADIREVS